MTHVRHRVLLFTIPDIHINGNNVVKVENLGVVFIITKIKHTYFSKKVMLKNSHKILAFDLPHLLDRSL